MNAILEITMISVLAVAFSGIFYFFYLFIG